jgi:hypothetical protein
MYQDAVVVSTIIDIIFVAVATAIVAVIVVTIVLVARGRPPRPSGTLPDRHYRVRGRSMAGWQRSAIREIRRAGREHGRRGRRRR